MNPNDFKFYSAFLLEKAGYAINEDKIYLLESRLTPVIKKWQLDSIADMIPQLRLGQNKELFQDVIDAMMTNETLFFRDDKPFKQLRNTVLPTVLQNRETQKKLRIWSAACSTGQEPYSIGMILRETMPTIAQWKIEILATDLSQTALEQAKEGKFSQFEIQRGLPISMAMKNFVQQGVQWQINETLRNMVKFEAFNLLDKMERLGTFDIILCRNVLIYFEEEIKRNVLLSLSKRLAPDGFLFLGGSETIIGLSNSLEPVSGCSGLYTLQKSTTSASISKRVEIVNPIKASVSTS
jgi:chemotaxis protein methyltransferase CheR